MNTEKKRVVVLDDDHDMLRAVQRLLVAGGFQVETTTSPKWALERVVCEPVHAIVSDLHMPELGGNVVLSMLAQAAPRTARVLMTAERDFSTLASLVVPYSVHAFVSKHQLSERLVAVIDELCAGRPDENASAMTEDARGLARSIVKSLAMRKYESLEHCERVAAWSRRLASAMGLSPSRVFDVELGALLHDIGQIGIPDAVLMKPGALNEAEWEELRKHPTVGVSLLMEIPALRRAIPVVECHHERRDGRGYPRGLTGNAIPLDARVFQLVDAYDALVSDRPHRKGRSHEAACAELEAHVGPQFDPEVFQAFSAISKEDWLAVVAHINASPT